LHVHDFRGKLSDPSVAPAVEDYLRRARARRAGAVQFPSPVFGPISVNIDLTMACDYRCGHCIDIDLLNGGLKFEFLELEDSLRVLRGRGLRSVILIGGGEPALHPDFERLVLLIKSLGLQCAIVSNGAHNDRIAAVAHCLENGDWVRLSLDAGTDHTFQVLHRPRKAVTLDHICRTAASIKARWPRLQLGFSFIVMWSGLGQISAPATGNVGEMALAAGLAKAHGFDYISFKPMLVRNEERAEIVNIGRLPDAPRPLVPAPVVDQIRTGLRQAEAMEGATFRVVPSKNLLAMLQESGFERCRQQPRECHMQHFRQVLAPSGIFSCPAHRGNERTRIGDGAGYSGMDGFPAIVAATQAQIQRLNAAVECREITCIYNDTNWWIEDLIESGEALTPGAAADLFL
jgi:hypothetical protein